MRTPKNYTQLVNDKIITNEMIAECIYKDYFQHNL